MRRKRSAVPAFLELIQSGKRAFVPSDEYLRVPVFRQQATKLALIDLARWRDQYGNILEILGHVEGRAIVHQIDKLKGKLGRK
jgi:hypothetical protein